MHGKLALRDLVFALARSTSQCKGGHFTALFFVFIFLGLSQAPACAGGSCQNNGDCDDNNACTTDACVNSNCQHDPVQPGTACGDNLNTVCTDPDTCNASGVCLRNDAANGTACVSPNPCISGESCNSGICVGTWTLGCCINNPDCNDHNPCTNELCISNSCQRINAAPGTPCGSSVDDACTDPDTCNATGECQNNDTADGQSCGAPECLGGQCGGTTYRAVLLPEGNSIGSVARGAFSKDGRSYVSGNFVSSTSVEHAVVWTCVANGTNCTAAVLPEDGAGSSVANGIACDDQGTCLSVGYKGSPQQPASWLYNGSDWAAEQVPLPPGATGGRIHFVEIVPTPPEYKLDERLGVGSSVSAQGFGRATVWERDEQGVWNGFLLPDYGVPGRESEATSVAFCSDDSCPPGDLGSRLFGGWAEDPQGVARLVVWRETGPSSGNFTMIAPPLPAGAVQLALQEATQMESRTRIWAGSGAWPGILVTNTVVLVDGTTRGVVWKTDDLQTWTGAVLPPQPGHASSAASGGLSLFSTADFDTLVWGGRSGGTPPDPLTQGVATQWTLNADTLAPTSGPTDLNSLVLNLPQNSSVFEWGGELIDTNHSVLISSMKLEHEGVAGNPQPHAAILIAGPPAGIPAVSTWGMAVMALVLLTVGMLIHIHRERIQAGYCSHVTTNGSKRQKE